MSHPLLAQIKENLMKGKANDVKALCEKAVAEKLGVKQILDEGLIAAMAVIGDKFKRNEVYVPEVLIAARAMNAGMSVLKPLLKQAGVKARGKICLGTVKGDLHDIGKNLVGMMLEGAGYEVVDLGVNVEPEKFVSAAQQHKPDIIAMSALLTTTMGAMKSTVEALKAAGSKARTMVGGAPLTDSFAKEIGASGYAPDAASAVDLANKLMAA